MENNDNIEKKERKKLPVKRLLVSAGVGLGAVALFLAVYLGFFRNGNAVLYEGAGVYTAETASASGIKVQLDEEIPMTIELKENGKCTFFVGNRKRRGNWSRTGDKMQLNCGRLVFYGKISEGEIRLSEVNGESAELLYRSEERNSYSAAEESAGEWTVSSVTDRDNIYQKKQLKQIGYDGLHLTILPDGSGTALLMDGEEKPIRLFDDAVEYDGRLLDFSYTEKELYLQYAENVLFVFERAA